MRSEQYYSGKFIVRVPPFLHEKLAKAAMDQGVSLNSLVQAWLAESVAKLSAEKRIKRLEKGKKGAETT